MGFASVLAVSLLGVGAANAAPQSCLAQHKALGKMGQEILTLQAEREKVVEEFEHHNDARAAAKNDLAMAGLDASGDSAEALEIRVATHHEAAEELKTQLAVLNSTLAEKGAAYNEKTEAFNKACTE